MTAPAKRTISSRSPGRLAAYAGMSVGLAMVLGAAWMLLGGNDSPVPMAIAFVVAGGLELTTSWFSLRAVRVAWSFACSLNATAFVVFLFGTPKLRDALDIPIAVAMVPCLVFGAIATLYILASDEY